MSAFFAFILTKVITFLSLIPLFTTVKFENPVLSVRWHNLDRLSPWYEADALDQWRTPYRTYFLLDLFFYYSYISNRTDWNYFPYGRGLQIKCVCVGGVILEEEYWYLIWYILEQFLCKWSMLDVYGVKVWTSTDNIEYCDKKNII